MSSGQNRSREQCYFFDEFAWRETFLTENIRMNLIAMTSINSLAAISSIVLNALVIAAVISRRQLRSKSNKLLACLAGTDLMVGALAQPLFIASEVKHILGAGPYCEVDTISIFVMFFVSVASFHQLTLISIERYIAIKHALRYGDIMTNRRLKSGVLFVWVVSFVETVSYTFPAILNKQAQLFYLGYIDATLAGVDVVSVSVIIYTNAYICTEARRLKRLRSEQVSQEEAKRLKKENKAAQTVIIILGVFLVSSLPYSAHIVCLHFASGAVEGRVLYVMACWATTAAMLSSLFNPLIYCWRLKKFRGAFLELLHL